MKKCQRCLKLKPKQDFCKHRLSKDGLNFWCRPCANKQCRDYNNKYPERRLSQHMKRVYGITFLDYINILESQNDSCAICKIHITKLTKRLAVDHNHLTGKVRGLLCDNCNKGLGCFFSDYGSTFLENAVKYTRSNK